MTLCWRQGNLYAAFGVRLSQLGGEEVSDACSCKSTGHGTLRSRRRAYGFPRKVRTTKSDARQLAGDLCKHALIAV